MGWLPHGEILWMDEAFSDKIEKIQEADEDTEDYAMGSNVESDNGDGFQDTVWQIMVSGFPIILKEWPVSLMEI